MYYIKFEKYLMILSKKMKLYIIFNIIINIKKNIKKVLASNWYKSRSERNRNSLEVSPLLFHFLSQIISISVLDRSQKNTNRKISKN